MNSTMYSRGPSTVLIPTCVYCVSSCDRKGLAMLYIFVKASLFLSRYLRLNWYGPGKASVSRFPSVVSGLAHRTQTLPFVEEVDLTSTFKITGTSRLKCAHTGALPDDREPS